MSDIQCCRVYRWIQNKPMQSLPGELFDFATTRLTVTTCADLHLATACCLAGSTALASTRFYRDGSRWLIRETNDMVTEQRQMQGRRRLLFMSKCGLGKGQAYTNDMRAAEQNESKIPNLLNFQLTAASTVMIA